MAAAAAITISINPFNVSIPRVPQVGAPHSSVISGIGFLQTKCPSDHQTVSVKALKITQQY